ncbi:SdiA-regulated domain-containing protein [Pontibacter sp. MBLB2868]|uniref:SdiA-regulated domain-containing protein n=1 Tax=Pontibacter sp. MBLB2868 TaxID=3451555 RepID=UPI003F74BDAB
MLKVLAAFLAATALMIFSFRDIISGDDETDDTGGSKSFVKIASLPGEISESSGVVALFGQHQLVTHNDAGNKPYLYKLDYSGNIVETIKLKLPNVDWEDLTIDKDGNIYIADSGNNNNNRRELAVYKVNLNTPSQIQAIRYTYEDQKEYPPSKKNRNFDSEAIFWADGYLYLISKDRGRGEIAKVYRLPDTGGQYKAKLVGSRHLKALVTGAAISPDGETVALLSEEKLHLFTDYSSPAAFYKGKYEEVKLKGAGQTEGVAFEDDETLVITSEGGNLYRYKL